MCFFTFLPAHRRSVYFCAGAHKGLQLKLDGLNKELSEGWRAQQRPGWAAGTLSLRNAV